MRAHLLGLAMVGAFLGLNCSGKSDDEASSQNDMPNTGGRASGGRTDFDDCDWGSVPMTTCEEAMDTGLLNETHCVDVSTLAGGAGGALVLDGEDPATCPPIEAVQVERPEVFTSDCTDYVLEICQPATLRRGVSCCYPALIAHVSACCG